MGGPKVAPRRPAPNRTAVAAVCRSDQATDAPRGPGVRPQGAARHAAGGGRGTCRRSVSLATRRAKRPDSAAGYTLFLRHAEATLRGRAQRPPPRRLGAGQGVPSERRLPGSGQVPAANRGLRPPAPLTMTCGTGRCAPGPDFLQIPQACMHGVAAISSTAPTGKGTRLSGLNRRRGRGYGGR